MGVIPALDELEHRHARLDLSAEVAAVEQLAFKGGEKALAHRIVEAITDRTHRGSQPSLPAAHPEGDRRVLRALVGMMDHPGGPALRQRHVQGFEHQLGARMSLHRPAHDPAAEGVQHYREILEASPGRDIGDVSHPQPNRE